MIGANVIAFRDARRLAVNDDYILEISLSSSYVSSHIQVAMASTDIPLYGQMLWRDPKSNSDFDNQGHVIATAALKIVPLGKKNRAELYLSDLSSPLTLPHLDSVLEVVRYLHRGGGGVLRIKCPNCGAKAERLFVLRSVAQPF